MKLIKHLGYLGTKVSWGEFLCSFCNKKVIRRLSSGKKQKSCGCATKELLSEYNKGNKNRFKHGMSKEKLYTVYVSMKSRCLSIKNKRYKDYGGRGITICPEWVNDYTKFRDWASSNGYQEGLEIDRMNNDLGYSPENCRWITHKENNRNKRNNKINIEQANEIRELFKINRYTQKEIADKYNISRRMVSFIINNKRWG